MKNIYKPLLISIIGNILLSSIKLAIGFYYSSIALISDGFHSLSDIITSAVGYLGIKISLKPPDKTHPFGHARFEPLVAFLVGESLLLVSYEIGRNAISRMIHRNYTEVNSLMLYITLASIAVKEGMARYSIHIGKKLNNQILIADAYHHRSDAMSSIAVLIGLTTQKFGFKYGDSLAGLLVAILLVKISLEIIWKNVRYLTGYAPHQELIEKIKQTALNNPNVLGIHNFKAHYIGTKLHVELHIEVSPKITLKEAHEICHKVKEEIEKIELVDRSFIHVDLAK